MKIEDPQQQLIKNANYRDKYRQTLRHLNISLMIAVALAICLIYMVLMPETIRNYASKTNGEVVSLYALNEPVITQPHLLQWAEIAARTAYNIDFANYKDQLAKAQPLFTPAAWQQFQMALNKTGLLTAIIDKKLVMQAVVSGAAQIMAQGVYQGHYLWKVRMPLLVTFSSASEQSRSNMVVTMNIARVPDFTVPEGIQIADFNVVMGSGAS